LEEAAKVGVVMLHVADGWGQQFLEGDLEVADGVEEVGQAVAVEALVDLAEEVLVVVVLVADGRL
jgi:hypothetical protein